MNEKPIPSSTRGGTPPPPRATSSRYEYLPKGKSPMKPKRSKHDGEWWTQLGLFGVKR